MAPKIKKSMKLFEMLPKDGMTFQYFVSVFDLAIIASHYIHVVINSKSVFPTVRRQQARQSLHSPRLGVR